MGIKETIKFRLVHFIDSPALYLNVVVFENKVCNQYMITIILSENKFVLFQLMLSIQKQNFVFGEIWDL